MKFVSRAGSLMAFGPVWLFLLLGALSQVVSAPNAAPAETSSYSASLQYQETSEVLILQSINTRLESSSFAKEPSGNTPDRVRGLLQWSPRFEPPIPFLWDREQGRLWLDLNCNRDLTDDSKGTFASGTNGNFQTFTNIQLTRATSAGSRPVFVQLNFSSYQPGRVNVAMGLCSYWHTRLRLGDQDWQFGLVEDALEGRSVVSPKYLLLRRWAEREQPFHLRTASPDFFDYSTNLFLGGHQYVLDCRFESQGTAPVYRATLREQPSPLGELTVAGANLHRLILTDDQRLTVILDRPAGTFKMPVGRYLLDAIWLRKGDTEAACFKPGRITVNSQQPATLMAGGPLTNSVKIRSDGMQVNLNYELLGADGRAYRLPRPDYQNPPEFVLFRGTNQLAADKFKYG